MNLPCRGWYFDRFREWHLFYLALGIILVLLGYSSMALAGGIEIDPRRIAFDQDPEKREFPPNRVINFTFHYRAWAYAGKPNQYIVFELRNRERSSPVRFFITYIDREEGFITARFSLPDPDTTYNLTYHVVTFFSHKPMIGSMFGGFVTLKEEEAIKKFYKTNYSGTQEIAEVRSLSGEFTT
jgi:hypothetical protein